MKLCLMLRKKSMIYCQWKWKNKGSVTCFKLQWLADVLQPCLCWRRSQPQCCGAILPSWPSKASLVTSSGRGSYCFSLLQADDTSICFSDLPVGLNLFCCIFSNCIYLSSLTSKSFSSECWRSIMLLSWKPYPSRQLWFSHYSRPHICLSVLGLRGFHSLGCFSHWWSWL